MTSKFYGVGSSVTPVWVGTSAAGQSEIGIALRVNDTTPLTALFFYATADLRKPEILRLWDASTGLEVTRATSVTTPTAEGWTRCPVPAGTNLVPGTEYRVTGAWPYQGYTEATTGGSTVVHDSPIIAGATLAAYTNPFGSAWGAPNAGYGTWVGVDVEVGGTVPGTGGSDGSTGTGSATFTGDLEAWLSSLSAKNLHKDDGLPWLTKTVVDAILTAVQNVPKATDPDWVTVLKLWQIAGALSDAEIAAWNLFAKRAPAQLTGASGGGGSAFFTQSGTLTSDVIVANQDTLTFMRRPLDDFPTSYTLVDERDYDGAIIWTVEADVFVHQITAWPDTASSEDVAGRVKLPYAGWWAPQAVSLPQARRFLEFDQQLCEWLPRRMKGAFFHLKDGYSGHVQALTHV